MVNVEKQETVRCNICLSWMCWDCSLVNEEQQIYVEESEDVHGLIWSCQAGIVNKLDALTELNKIIKQLEQEIEEMRMQFKRRQEKMKMRKKNSKGETAGETSQKNKSYNMQKETLRTCKFNMQGHCQYGRRGQSCPNQHPSMCFKFLRYGTSNKLDCTYSHPKMCKTALTTGRCDREKTASTITKLEPLDRLPISQLQAKVAPPFL